MIINSDWHIHSFNSYDATLSLEEIYAETKKLGFKKFGITDHVSYNDTKFLTDLKNSAESVKEFQKTHPEIVLGVELTPVAGPEFDYAAKHGTRDGFVQPHLGEPYEIKLALTKEELINYGVRYAIGASHWRIDKSEEELTDKYNLQQTIREWYRQQMWLACDERVTILGHPWYHGKALWYDDFSVIPHSMNMDIAAALKENGKYVECNVGTMLSLEASAKFSMQYAEFIRELFEMGIPVTFGSDSHQTNEYRTSRILKAEELLKSVGFKEGDFSEIAEEHLW